MAEKTFGEAIIEMAKHAADNNRTLELLMVGDSRVRPLSTSLTLRGDHLLIPTQDGGTTLLALHAIAGVTMRQSKDGSV